MTIGTREIFAARARSPYGRRNRLARLLWGFVQATLFAWSPRPCHGFRCLLLRAFGAKIAPRVHVYPRAEVWAPWNLEVGEGTGIADRAILYNHARITIGRRCVISQLSHLCAATHDYRDPAFPLVARPISIGDDCWIAAGAFVHPGVTLPAGVVIGACAVVTSSLPPWTVCAGNPCGVVKPREPHG